jgi:hypothetical protein
MMRRIYMVSSRIRMADIGVEVVDRHRHRGMGVAMYSRKQKGLVVR